MSNQQSPDAKKGQDRDWYSVSVASVQRVTTLIGLVVFLIIAAFGYSRWLAYTQEDRALALIEQATQMMPELAKRGDVGETEKKEARDMLVETREEFDKGNFSDALEKGQACVDKIEYLLGEGRGSIRVVSVRGNVEYRRGERGSWKRLRSSDSLNPGDWVKTGDDASARLLFNDTSSQYTLRQATLVHLGSAQGSGSEATEVQKGALELNTSDQGSTVATPKSFAEVRGDSEALVSFDDRRQAAQFSAYEGGLKVSSKSGGEVREVGALQQVAQIGDVLSNVRALPAKPVLLEPANDHSIDLEQIKEVTLAWQPVDRARRYQLRISTTQLFADNLVDNRRTKSSARLGIRGEGNFYWQVAAMDGNGARGPWSETRAFRVASLAMIADVSDRTPPELEIIGTEVFGVNVIVNGRTEPGASVVINDKKVPLKPDGSFETTVEFTTGGNVEIVIVASDAWNNSATKIERVFIDESI